MDVECLMGAWYREADRDAWCDVVEIESDLGEIRGIAPSCNKQRFELAAMTMDLRDLLAFIAEGLVPHLRLAATDRSARESLRR